MVDTVGTAVRNQGNVLQIDGTYTNQQFLYKADFTIPVSPPDGDMWGGYIDLTVPAGRGNVMMAIASTAAAGVYVVRKNNTNFRVYRGSMNQSSVVTFTAYFFADPEPITATGGVGFVVRHPTTGKVVYRSDFRYLRILQFAPVDLYMPIDANATPSLASFSFPGKTLAIVQCVRPNGRRQNPAGNPQQPVGVFGFFGGTMQVVGSTANITHRVIASAVGPNGTSVATQTFGTYMIIDVTGF